MDCITDNTPHYHGGCDFNILYLGSVDNFQVEGHIGVRLIIYKLTDTQWKFLAYINCWHTEQHKPQQFRFRTTTIVTTI